MPFAPPRRLFGALAAIVTVGLPALAHGQASSPEQKGPDFEALLLADAKVTGAVKAALRADTAFTEPAAFGDLTGDGVSDAVVLVATPGAAGAVAVFAFSTLGDDEGRLRVIYRSQRLYRAFVRVRGGALIVLTADYARGDDVCCPAARLERTYAYDRRTRAFGRIASRRLSRTPG